MEACLQSLLQLRYPNFEVDRRQRRLEGRDPRDRAALSGFALIHQENKGLSIARNVGMEAATGEIIAFTDSRLRGRSRLADYLVGALQRTAASAVGGPNLPPPEDSRGARRAWRPRRADRPTCCSTTTSPSTFPAATWRFAARPCARSAASTRSSPRPATTSISAGGCRTAAGSIGFSPAAMVWHFRRNTVKAYLKPAARLRQGGSAAVFQAPVPLQHARPIALARTDLRRFALRAALAPAGDLLWHVRAGALPDALRAAESSALRYLAVHARVDGRGAVSAASARSCRGATSCRRSIPLAISWAAAAALASGRELDPRYQDWRSRAAARIAHLPRPATSLLRALQMAAARPCQRGARPLRRAATAAAGLATQGSSGSSTGATRRWRRKA